MWWLEVCDLIGVSCTIAPLASTSRMRGLSPASATMVLPLASRCAVLTSLCVPANSHTIFPSVVTSTAAPCGRLSLLERAIRMLPLASICPSRELSGNDHEVFPSASTMRVCPPKARKRWVIASAPNAPVVMPAVMPAVIMVSAAKNGQREIPLVPPSPRCFIESFLPEGPCTSRCRGRCRTRSSRRASTPLACRA